MKKQIGSCLLVFGLLAASAYGQRGTPVSACSKPTLYQSDVGGEYVAIVGVRSLDSVIDDLQPKFDLTPQGALQAAVPDTLNSSQSALSSLNAAMQVGLMLSPSTTGAQPPTATAPSQPVSPMNLLTNLPGGLSVDPALQYRAGAALYEQVKLLNRSLKDVPHFRNYTPYIVTVQVALIPYRREAPYDAYSDVAFFTDTNTPPTLPNPTMETIPLVYPLPASDALEMSNDQQSRNQLRELSFALAAVLHGAGIQAGVSSLHQNLDALNGYDLNSLLTVGKISQNCMQVRIGARNQASAAGRLNMVPETHSVSFLVFAPRNANELQMLSRTTFRDIQTHEILQETAHESIDGAFITDVLTQFLPPVDEKMGAFLKQRLKTDNTFHKTFDEYLDKIGNITFDMNTNWVFGASDANFNSNDTNNLPFVQFQQTFKGFFTNENILYSVSKALQAAGFDHAKPKSAGRKSANTNAATGSIAETNQAASAPVKPRARTIEDILNHLKTDPFGGMDVNDINAIWLDTTRTGLGDQYGNDLVPLPDSTPHLPPTNQWVLYQDDEQSQTSTYTLVNNSGRVLSTDKLTAILTATNFDDTLPITLISTSIKPGGTTALQIQFPLLSQITLPGGKTNKLAPMGLKLDYGQPADDDYATSNYLSFASIGKTKAPAGPQAWSIKRTYGGLIAGQTNQFEIVLASSTLVGTNMWYLDVANAEVSLNNPTNGVVAAKPDGVFALTATNVNTRVAFTVGPLPAGQTVEFNLLDEKETVVTNLFRQVVQPVSSQAK
jgi:hypothetical protein